MDDKRSPVIIKHHESYSIKVPKWLCSNFVKLGKNAACVDYHFSYILFYELDDKRSPVIIKQHESMYFNMKKAYYLLAAKCNNITPYLLQLGISSEFGKKMT